MPNFQITDVSPTGTESLRDISANGKFVSYTRVTLSAAGVPTTDLYVKNLDTGAVRLITSFVGVDTDPRPDTIEITTIDGGALSSNGKYIIYSTGIPGARLHDSINNLYVANVETGAITRVNSDPNNSSLRFDPAGVSDDGRFVLYDLATYSATYKNGIIDTATQNATVILSDLALGTATTLTSISTTANGFLLIFDSPDLAIDLSGDGRFASYKDNTVSTKIFDRTDGSIDPAAGMLGVPNTLSDDGRYCLIAINSQLYRRDLTTGSNLLVSTGEGGAAANAAVNDFGHAAMSGNGRYVVFSSNATNLVAGTASGNNIYLKDLTTGTIQKIGDNLGASLQDVDEVRSLVSNDGRVVFTSNAGGVNNVFLAELPAARSADDTYRAGYDRPLVVDAATGVLANDTDFNNSALKAVLLNGPSHGDLALNQDGSFTYTPSGTFIGTDTFTYRADNALRNGQPTNVSLIVEGNIRRVSTTELGVETADGADQDTPVFSPDGKLLLFSAFDRLVPQDTDRFADVVLKDLTTGAVTLVSTGLSDGHANSAVFSADGTKIAFAFDGSAEGIYVKNITTGTLTRVSTAADGSAGNSISGKPAFSPDGTKVVFQSFSTNLVAGDTNGEADIFVKDLVTGSIQRVSDSPSGVIGNSYSAWPVFSPDGQKVAFVSASSNLVVGDTNNGPDIFVRNLVTGAVTRVSTGADGSQANGGSDTPIFSADGTKIAFTSGATNFVAGDTNFGTGDLFIKDLVTGAVTRASSSDTGKAGTGTSLTGARFPSFSADGTKIAFSSNVNDLVAGDTDRREDVFVKDLTTGAIRRVSTDSFELPPDGFSTRPTFSPDGKLLAFYSRASNLVPGDTNGGGDIFVKDLTRFPIGSPLNNTAPVATGDAYATQQDTRLVVPVKGVLANDTDAEGDTLTASLVSGPAHGALVLNANGSLTYTPMTGYVGADSFTYRASDGKASSNLAAVSLTVNAVAPVNNPPTALSFTGGTVDENAAAGTVVGTLDASDPDGDALTYQITGGSGFGRFSIAGSTVVVAPGAVLDFEAQDAFDLQVVASDGTLTSLAETFAITLADAEEGANGGIRGLDGGELLVGTPAIDVIAGNGGDDTLIGLGDGDALYGGAAQDILIGDGPVSLTAAAESVRRLYIATLDRAPDDAGWQGWTATREGGRSLEAIAAGFVDSAEFQQKYGALSNAAFVSQLYRNVLDREPDAAGLAAHVAALDAGGLTRTEVVTSFSESDEFKAAVSPELQAGQVYRLYGATLARAPDTAGFAGWAEALSGGKPLAEIAAGFVDSPEFQQTYGATDSTRFVTLLYQNVLGRAPDQVGLDGWRGQLDSQALTRTQVVTGFSESPEFIVGTRAAVDGFMRNVMTAWSDTLLGGAGDDRLTGGHGADRYVFSRSDGGNDTIHGFDGFDTLELNGFGFATPEQALAAMIQQGGDVVFSYQGGSITFGDTPLATLQRLPAQGWLLG